MFKGFVILWIISALVSLSLMAEQSTQQFTLSLRYGKEEIMEYTKALNAITEALKSAEMRQGCTNHSYYAEILLNELGLPDVYEALNLTINNIQTLSDAALHYKRTFSSNLDILEKALAKAEVK